MPAPLRLSVEIETKDHGILGREVTGVLEQVTLVAVSDATRRSLHAIVSLGAGAAPPAGTRLRAISAALPARHVSVVLTQREGEIDMIAAQADDALLLSAAAAAATAARSGSWDESPEIAVSIGEPAGRRFVVDPVYSAGSWSVTVLR
jgi:hypothetical protein